MRRVVLLVSVAGGLAGLLLALALPWPDGLIPFAPSNATSFYPPDLFRQRILWTVIGIVSGLGISGCAWWIWSHVRFSRGIARPGVDDGR